jgi:hypothetical protein
MGRYSAGKSYLNVNSLIPKGPYEEVTFGKETKKSAVLVKG